VTKTTRQSLFIGSFWGLLGSVMLLGAGGHAVLLVVSIVWLVLAGGYLASAVARYRREHSRAGSHTTPGPRDLPQSS
jgi:hypothetical protein